MKILFVSDLKFFQPWYEWLSHQAFSHDLLIIAGELLDKFHPLPTGLQIEWISEWVATYPGALRICSDQPGGARRASSSSPPPSWLSRLHTRRHWTQPGMTQFGDASILLLDRRGRPPDGQADLWVSHHGPPGGSVDPSVPEVDPGDDLLEVHLMEQRPKLLLHGKLSPSTPWRRMIHDTLCLTTRPGNPGPVPNHILIDTVESTARWITCDDTSAYIERIPTCNPSHQGDQRDFRPRQLCDTSLVHEFRTFKSIVFA